MINLEVFSAAYRLFPYLVGIVCKFFFFFAIAIKILDVLAARPLIPSCDPVPFFPIYIKIRNIAGKFFFLQQRMIYGIIVCSIHFFTMHIIHSNTFSFTSDPKIAGTGILLNTGYLPIFRN